jgi:hypothetical protein
LDFNGVRVIRSKLHADALNILHFSPKSQTIILPVVLFGLETWSPTLREEHRLRVFENRMLRRTFGPKRDEVTGRRRKLHNEELYDLYCSPSIIRMIKPRRMRWAGHVARMGEKRNGGKETTRKTKTWVNG